MVPVGRVELEHLQEQTRLLRVRTEGSVRPWDVVPVTPGSVPCCWYSCAFAQLPTVQTALAHRLCQWAQASLSSDQSECYCPILQMQWRIPVCEGWSYVHPVGRLPVHQVLGSFPAQDGGCQCGEVWHGLLIWISDCSFKQDMLWSCHHITNWHGESV